MSEYDEFFTELHSRPAEEILLDLDKQQAEIDVRQVYQPYVQANQESLQRVQERLEARLRRQQGNLRVVRPVPPPIEQPERTQKVQKSIEKTKRTSSALLRVLGTIAAVLVVAVLVGSMIVVLNGVGKKGQNSTPGAKKTQAAPPVVQSSGIYMITEKDYYTNAISKADLLTHKVLWEYSQPNITASPVTVFGDTVYFSTSDEKNQTTAVYALDANSGKVRWYKNFDKNIVYGPGGSGPYNLGYLTQPVHADGLVFIKDRTGKITALDAKDGKTRWVYETRISALVEGSIQDSGNLSVSDGVLYAAQYNTLFALKADKGTEIWKKALSAQDQTLSGVEVIDGVLYSASEYQGGHHGGLPIEGHVYAFNAKTGALNWDHRVAEQVTVLPTIVDGKIYFMGRHVGELTDGVTYTMLYALSKEGKQLWSKKLSSDTVNSVVVEGDLLYYSQSAYDNGKLLSYQLFAVKTQNGEEAWKLNVVADPLQVVGGVLYARSGSSGDRLILAFDAKSGKKLWQQQYGVDLIDKYGNHNAMSPLFVVVP